MKKTIFTLALAIISMTGLSAAAQTASTNRINKSDNKTTTEQTTRKKADKEKAPRYNPFEGLNLTEKQQNELKALRSTSSEAGKSQKGKVSRDSKNGKELSKAEKQAKRQQRMEQKIQNRRDYLAKVKTILSPEQYVKFLENSYVDRNMKKAQGSKHISKRKGGKKSKK